MSQGRRSFAVAAGRQRGNLLLEALIGVLIVAFGILGLIGLQAKTMQNVTDAQFRSEAVFLANSLISQMWVADQTQLPTNFSSALGGPNYTEFANFVAARLPGATGANAPTVVVSARGGGSINGTLLATNATLVTVTVFWVPPGDTAAGQVHEYIARAVVETNP